VNQNLRPSFETPRPAGEAPLDEGCGWLRRFNNLTLILRSTRALPACVSKDGRTTSSMAITSSMRERSSMAPHACRSGAQHARLHRRRPPSSMSSMRATSSMRRAVINGGRHLSGALPWRQPAIAGRPAACDSPAADFFIAVKAHNRPGRAQGGCWCCPPAEPASGTGSMSRVKPLKKAASQRGDP